MIDLIFHEAFFTMSMRLLLALVLSGFIGFEREINNHAAGFRTHILVGVSSTLLMLMSLYGFESYMEAHSGNVTFDPARIPSYVISGIGFLGAGTIIVNGMTVKGLTTAASIWAVAGLGLVVGIGMYDIAILTTIIILLSLVLLNKLEYRISKQRNIVSLMISIRDIHAIEDVLKKCHQHDMQIKAFNVTTDENEDATVYTDIQVGKAITVTQLMTSLSNMEDVNHVEEK